MSQPGTEAYAVELEEDAYVEELIQELYKSTALFSRVVYPGRFKREFGPLHPRLFDVLDDPTYRQVVVMAHRDFGKTSILQLGYASKCLLYLDASFIVPISCSATQAKMQSENLKMALITNDMIKRLWGELKPETREMPFSQDMWTVKIKGAEQPSVVLPRGSGQQLRGLIFGDKRPDLILPDDLEDPENLLSEENRAKQKRWFFSSMKNIVDIAEKNWRIIMMGTSVHQNCLLWGLAKSKHWKFINIPLCIEDKTQKYNLRTLWPSRFDQETVDGMISEARENSTLDEWYMEYMNQTGAGENAAFSQNMFRYYDPAEVNLNDYKVAENVVIVDPAKTVKMDSAETGIIGIAIGVKENKFWVREAVGEKLYPEQVYNNAIDMAIRIKAHVIAVEVTSLEDWIKHPFLDACAKRGLSFHFIWLKARGKKEDRVRELVYYYRQGHVFHNMAACARLEMQLLSFPFSQYWDIMDAFAYLPKVLEEGERYFHYYGSDYEDEDAIEEEYMELLEEDEREMELEGWEVLD